MTKKLITKTGTEDGYNQFLKKVNLYALGLDSMSADLKREAYAIAHAESASEVVRFIENQFDVIEFTQEHFDVRATYCLRVKLEGAAPVDLPQPPPTPGSVSLSASDELLCIRTSFTAHFHCKKISAGKSYADRFAQSEARLIFWPYFRQTISDTTARMSIRPITIPLTLRP
jgi:hypothetical protein